MKKLLVALFVALLMAGCGGEKASDSDGNHSAKAPVDKKWAAWEANPEPYGGLEVLAKIRAAKESGDGWVYLHSNQISDLTPFEGLTELDYLVLYSNQITDLTPLAKLTSLTSLDLGENSITDLTPLAGLTKLERLWLGYNKITEVAPLAGLTELEWLSLFENNITDAQKEMLKKALPNCEIYF